MMNAGEYETFGDGQWVSIWSSARNNGLQQGYYTNMDVRFNALK